jgi:post-segregation antitoxin (ccd killing protein)
MSEKTKRTKKVCSVYIHSDIREKVKKIGINMSATCENALENLVEKIEKAEI